MHIGSAGSQDAAQTFNLWRAVRARQTVSTGTDTLAGAVDGTSQATTAVSSSRSSNMLSTHFVQSNYQRSAYLSSTIDSYQTQKTLSNRMDSLLGSLTAQFSLVASQVHAADGNSQFLAGTLMQHRIEDGVGQVVRQDVADRSEQTFEEIKATIEEQAAAPGTDTGTAQAASAAQTDAIPSAARATADGSGGTGQEAASAAATAAAQAFAAAAASVATTSAQASLDVVA